MDVPAPTAQAPIAGRYETERLLSEREICRSWVARDRVLDRRVFLKILRDDRRHDAIARTLFLREIAVLKVLAARGRLACVPMTHDAGEADQRPFLVQELLEGWSVSQGLRELGPQGGPDVVVLAMRILAAVAALHGAGVVHGDLSPDNVMVVTPERPWPRDYEVRLIDFNSASAGGADPPRSILVKPARTAPEIAVGDPTTVRSDVYALGYMLYEWLAGSPPFVAPTLEAMLEAVARGLPAMPPERNIPSALDALVGRMLARDPAQRPSIPDCLALLGGLASAPPRRPVPGPEVNDGGTIFAQSAPPGVTGIRGVPLDALAGMTVRLRFALARLLGRRGARRPPAVPERPPPTVTGPTDERPDGTRTVLRVAWPAKEPPDGQATMSAAVPRKAPMSAAAPPRDPRFHSEASIIQRVPVRGGDGGTEGSDGDSPVDHLDFSVFAPDSRFVLEVWAYLRRQRDEMLALARRESRLIERGSRGPVQLAAGEPIALVLQLDGFDVQDAQDVLCWTGEITNVPFIVHVPSSLTSGTHPGQIRILQSGCLIARLVFDVVVRADADASRGMMRTRASRVRSAFASYATEDRSAVLARVQAFAAAGIDVFVDVLALRSGDRWEQAVRTNIRERDVFYLFWSAAARASTWVEREWRCALGERGLDYIHPIPLADPRDVPPPRELEALHFGDVFSAWLKEAGPRSA